MSLKDKRVKKMKPQYSRVFKAETYEQAENLCPKGYRMLEFWQLIKLAQEKHPIIFETEKGSFIFFHGKKDNYLHRLNRGTYGGWLGVRATWAILAPVVGCST